MKIKWPFFVMVCAMALGVIGAGCEEEHLNKPNASQGVDTRAVDEVAIRAASQEWSNAASSRNLERKAVSFYADDGTYNPPGAPLAAGKRRDPKSVGERAGDARSEFAVGDVEG